MSCAGLSDFSHVYIQFRISVITGSNTNFCCLTHYTRRKVFGLLRKHLNAPLYLSRQEDWLDMFDENACTQRYYLHFKETELYLWLLNPDKAVYLACLCL